MWCVASAVRRRGGDDNFFRAETATASGGSLVRQLPSFGEESQTMRTTWTLPILVAAAVCSGCGNGTDLSTRAAAGKKPQPKSIGVLFPCGDPPNGYKLYTEDHNPVTVRLVFLATDPDPNDPSNMSAVLKQLHEWTNSRV